MYCVGIEKKKRNAMCWEKTLGRDIKNEKSKEKGIFRTWDQICLDKLRELEKASLSKWALAMGYKYPGSMSKTAQDLEEAGKIRVVRTNSGRVKKSYEAI